MKNSNPYYNHNKNPSPYLSNDYFYNNKDNKKNNGYRISNTLKNLPFVSIMVPARNEEKHIKRCSLSLLSQDYPFFEIIAIDDNSTDSTLNIMNDIKNRTSKGEKIGLPIDKLITISLNDKPDNWTGKTWACQQGYLHK